MAKPCKKCSQSAKVSGMEDVPYMEMIAATVTAVAANKVDDMLTKNADGTAKTGFLVDNPMVKNLLFVAAGVGLTSYMDDEISKGVGIGAVTYGGYAIIMELMAKMYPPQTPPVNGVYGMMAVPPQNIGSVSPMNAAPRLVTGNYGVSPSIIDGMDNEELPQYAPTDSGLESGL